MNLFRNLWSSADGPSHSSSTPMALDQPTSDTPDRTGGTLSRSTGHRRSQSQSQSQSRSHPNAAPNQRRDHASQYSVYSTQGPFHSRMFFSENFMLGAGAVIIQPSSRKVVIVQDGDYWFLPKGRKDLGESIEQAALREAYEEVRVPLRLIPPLIKFRRSMITSLATDVNSCHSTTGRTPPSDHSWSVDESTRNPYTLPSLRTLNDGTDHLANT